MENHMAEEAAYWAQAQRNVTNDRNARAHAQELVSSTRQRRSSHGSMGEASNIEEAVAEEDYWTHAMRLSQDAHDSPASSELRQTHSMREEDFLELLEGYGVRVSDRVRVRVRVRNPDPNSNPDPVAWMPAGEVSQELPSAMVFLEEVETLQLYRGQVKENTYK